MNKWVSTSQLHYSSNHQYCMVSWMGRHEFFLKLILFILHFSCFCHPPNPPHCDLMILTPFNWVQAHTHTSSFARLFTHKLSQMIERHLLCLKDMENQFSNETWIVDGKIRRRCRGMFDSSAAVTRHITLCGLVHYVDYFTFFILLSFLCPITRDFLMQGPPLIWLNSSPHCVQHLTGGVEDSSVWSCACSTSSRQDVNSKSWWSKPKNREVVDLLQHVSL